LLAASSNGEGKYGIVKKFEIKQYYKEIAEDTYGGEYKSRPLGKLDRMNVIKLAVHRALQGLLPKIAHETGVSYVEE